ncbi:MAG: glycosyltransferase family 4 protein [Oscillatoria sp. SIO1A7]|nr:glycosyltransferase family 4 protein [Oscillatoria sp. SIO1A7]
MPLYKAVADRVMDFQMLISTPMEPNRKWDPDWEGLNVTVQRNITLKRSWRHPQGFSEPLYVHIPYDTIWLLRKLRPEVIISGEMGLRTLQALAYHKLAPKSKLILWAMVSEHSEQGRGWLRERLRPWLVSQADAVMVNGKSGARYVRQLGIAEEKIFLVTKTIDISLFASIPLDRDPHLAYRLLSVGQLVPRKGLEPFLSVLVRWVKAHPERNLEFWIVGDGPLRKTLERQVLPENLTLRFLGSLPYAKLPEIYAQAGIKVFPTLADEWGMVTNEAMAAGLPVLGSLYGQSVEELVVDGVTGWAFRPDDAEEMYSALDRALSTPIEVLAQMRREARNAISHLTIDFVADHLFEAIRYVS